MGQQIVTSHIYPPIPDRSHDWCAHYEGEEEAGNYGWGATEAEAIQDFNDNCREAHDERLGLVSGETLLDALPELLSALKFAVARVRHANEKGNPILSAWLPDAEAAILKATGDAA